MIDVLKHKDMLSAIASKYVSDLEELRFVPDVSKEGNRLGAGQDTPDRAGKCLKNRETGYHLILISERISEATKQSIIMGMRLRGSKERDLSFLSDNCNFIKHLVLHECAHANYAKFSELECDDWAFDRLRDEI